MAIQKNKKIETWGIFSGVVAIVIVIIFHYAFNVGGIEENLKKEKRNPDLPLQRYGSGVR